MKKTTQVLPLILMTIACGRGERPQAGVTEATASTNSSDGRPLSSVSGAARFEGSHAFGDFPPALRSLCLKYSGEGSQPVCCAPGEARWNADFYKTLVSANERGTKSDKVCPAPSAKPAAVLDNRPDATSFTLRWSFRSAAQTLRDNAASSNGNTDFSFVPYWIENITRVAQNCSVVLSVKYKKGDKVFSLSHRYEILLLAKSGDKLGSNMPFASNFRVAPEALLPGTLQLSAVCNGSPVATKGSL